MTRNELRQTFCGFIIEADGRHLNVHRVGEDCLVLRVEYGAVVETIRGPLPPTAFRRTGSTFDGYKTWELRA